MLFGGESRFHSGVKSRSGMVVYSKDSETADHVGPGVYFDKTIEDKRNGWKSKSFSKREPMAPGKRRNGSIRHDDRAFIYSSATLTSTGIALPSNPLTLNTPGPGYYSPPVVSARDRRKSSGTMGSTPRKISAKTVIRGDLLVQGGNMEPDIGPGYYSPQTTSLIRPSHNIHAQQKTPIKSSPLDYNQIYLNYSPAKASDPIYNGVKSTPSPKKYLGSRSPSVSSRDQRAASLPAVADYFSSPLVEKHAENDHVYKTPVS